MAISEAYAGSESVSTTEWDLPSDSSSKSSLTTDGVYQVWLDLSNLAAGDVFEFRGYEKVQSSDTQRAFMIETISGVQSAPNYVTPSFVLIAGWTFTLLRKAGSDRTITWSIRSVA